MVKIAVIKVKLVGAETVVLAARSHALVAPSQPTQNSLTRNNTFAATTYGGADALQFPFGASLSLLLSFLLSPSNLSAIFNTVHRITREYRQIRRRAYVYTLPMSSR